MSRPSLRLVFEPEELVRVEIDATNSAEEARLLNDLRSRQPRLLAELENVLEILERRSALWHPGDVWPGRRAA